jgi:3-dehydroquinate dehydratase I
MPARKSVKAAARPCRTVGVIATAAEFRLATQMADPPDLFELRLDRLFPARNLEKKVSRLRAPIIITARHPAEGGANHLTVVARRQLLECFLPWARYVDVELRSAPAFRKLLDQAQRHQVEVIVSFHDCRSTPSLGSLRAKAVRARALGAAVFKVATRTDTGAELGRLLEFLLKTKPALSVSAMGIGKLGALSRILLTRCGSVMVYTSLGKPLVPGQISLTEWRSMTAAAWPEGDNPAGTT